MTTTRMHAVVSGRVQGVGFRWSARAEAGRLGLAGWVRNLPDGTVEAEIEGSSEAVQRMLAWFGQGPSGAGVTAVDTADAAVTGEKGFEIR